MVYGAKPLVVLMWFDAAGAAAEEQRMCCVMGAACASAVLSVVSNYGAAGALVGMVRAELGQRACVAAADLASSRTRLEIFSIHSLFSAFPHRAVGGAGRKR